MHWLKHFYFSIHFSIMLSSLQNGIYEVAKWVSTYKKWTDAEVNLVNLKKVLNSYLTHRKCMSMHLWVTIPHASLLHISEKSTNRDKQVASLLCSTYHYTYTYFHAGAFLTHPPVSACALLLVLLRLLFELERIIFISSVARIFCLASIVCIIYQKCYYVFCLFFILF